jgi:hypothetical protein
MMTPQEYLKLSADCRRLAETKRDRHSRYQLQQLAGSYFQLAKTIEALNRSAKVVEALEEHWWDRRKSRQKKTPAAAGAGGEGEKSV